MKKRILSVLLAAGIFLLGGCSNNDELERLKEENSKLQSALEENGISVSTSSSESSSKPNITNPLDWINSGNEIDGVDWSKVPEAQMYILRRG